MGKNLVDDAIALLQLMKEAGPEVTALIAKVVGVTTASLTVPEPAVQSPPLAFGLDPPWKAEPAKSAVMLDPEYRWPLDVFDRCEDWARANMTVGSRINAKLLLKRIGYGRYAHLLKLGGSRAFTMRLQKHGFDGMRRSNGHDFLTEDGHNLFAWTGGALVR